MKGPKLPEGKTRQVLYTAVAAVLFLAVLIVFFQSHIQRVLLYPTKYEEQVQRYSAEYNVDPLLVYAVIRTESSFRPKAESPAGARGLMQMTEDTFEWIKTKIAPNEALTFEDLYQPDTAIRFGVYYLSISLQRYGGDAQTAAAAYHSGWGTVDRLLEDAEYTEDGKVLSQFPYSQMAHYVYKVQKNYNKYLSLYT